VSQQPESYINRETIANVWAADIESASTELSSSSKDNGSITMHAHNYILSDSPCVEYPGARTANTARGVKRGLLLQMSCRDVAWSVCACWWRGVVVSGIRRMNEVNPRRARLVPGWVTVFGRVHHLSM